MGIMVINSFNDCWMFILKKGEKFFVQNENFNTNVEGWNFKQKLLKKLNVNFFEDEEWKSNELNVGLSRKLFYFEHAQLELISVLKTHKCNSRFKANFFTAHSDILKDDA